jgi:uncharacterized protein YndB with AHSA1/START domain
VTQLNTSTSTADREIVTTRLIDAPRDRVWQAWTAAEHVAKWFGPRGFTNTFSRFELKPGGSWIFTMHGPDGTDYQNRIDFIEVVPLTRLVYTHSDPEGHQDPFQGVVTFEDEDGKTRLTLRTVFVTKEERDRLIETVGAVEGGRQTLERLAEYVAALS